MRYTERLAEVGAAPSVGRVGDAYDNALAESVIGLFKTELIHRRGPWRGFDDVEFATLEWVAWFNQQRLLEPLAMFRRQCSRSTSTVPTPLTPRLWHARNRGSGKPGAVQLRDILESRIPKCRGDGYGMPMQVRSCLRPAGCRRGLLAPHRRDRVAIPS